jgi:hypothetical protein
MMAIKRVKLSDTNEKKGKTRESVKNMSEDEIRRRASTDPDNPILTDEQLKEFKPVNKGNKQNGEES